MDGLIQESDLFAPLPKTQAFEEKKPSLPYWQDAYSRFSKNKVAVGAVIFLILLAVFALIVPMTSPFPYYETHLALKNQSPNTTFWFGTDDLGRDIFTRVACGARISLFIGISAALIDLFIGVLWGALAAVCGRAIDTLMMRVADIFYALPYLLMVILLMVILGSGLVPIIIALTLTGWIPMARIVRGQIMHLKCEEFVLAAQSLGASAPRVLFKHLIPNTMGPIIVTMTLTIPTAIFTEAFLSFLGLGVQAPIASWGTMASDALPALRYYPWRLFFPAFFISSTMLCLNLVGDALRDALDPRLRK